MDNKRSMDGQQKANGWTAKGQWMDNKRAMNKQQWMDSKRSMDGQQKGIDWQDDKKGSKR